MLAGVEAANPEAYADILSFISKRIGPGKGKTEPPKPPKPKA